MKLLTAGYHDMPAPKFLNLRNLTPVAVQYWNTIIANARDCKIDKN